MCHAYNTAFDKLWFPIQDKKRILNSIMLQYHHCVAFGFGFRMIKFKKPIEIGSLKLEERENAFPKFQLFIFFMQTAKCQEN